MTSDRFHRAARNGSFDILRETTSRDCNAKDDTGMTPTLWAAHEGNIEALRILVGRGGNPDKSDYWGNTALHLASARGHLTCVNFLVSFGANLFSVDIDNHSAQDLAAINNRDYILRILDTAVASLEMADKRKANKMKEKARKNYDKLMKDYYKRQLKSERSNNNMFSTLKQKVRRGNSMSNLSTVGQNNTSYQSYSSLVGSVTSSRSNRSGVHKKLLLKNKLFTKNINNDQINGFKISKVEDGKRSIRPISGIQKDSEVLYVVNNRNDKTYHDNEYDDENIKELTRTFSQPNLFNDCATHFKSTVRSRGSIFDRPGIGTIAFRPVTVDAMTSLSTTNSTGRMSEVCSIGSTGSMSRSSKSTLKLSWELESNDSDNESDPRSALENFLNAWGLSEYVDKLLEEKIDLEALMLLTEEDLKQLQLPLGHHRKLATAISQRRAHKQRSLEILSKTDSYYDYTNNADNS